MEEWEKCFIDCPFFDTLHYCIGPRCAFFQERTRSLMKAAGRDFPGIAGIIGEILQKGEISGQDFERFLNALAWELSKEKILA